MKSTDGLPEVYALLGRIAAIIRPSLGDTLASKVLAHAVSIGMVTEHFANGDYSDEAVGKLAHSLIRSANLYATLKTTEYLVEAPTPGLPN